MKLPAVHQRTLENSFLFDLKDLAFSLLAHLQFLIISQEPLARFMQEVANTKDLRWATSSITISIEKQTMMDNAFFFVTRGCFNNL